MLEAQFLFEETMARLRSPSLAARVVARRVGLPMFELVGGFTSFLTAKANFAIEPSKTNVTVRAASTWSSLLS